MCSDWIQGGEIHSRKKEREGGGKTKKEKGLDRVELRSWMENAPRNIPGIVWEQFSRRPGDDVSSPLRYKSREVARTSADCNRAHPGASSRLHEEPRTPETYPRGRNTCRELLRTLGAALFIWEADCPRTVHPRCWCLLLSLPFLEA